jgi:hypothetical protein
MRKAEWRHMKQRGFRRASRQVQAECMRHAGLRAGSCHAEAEGKSCMQKHRTRHATVLGCERHSGATQCVR